MLWYIVSFTKFEADIFSLTCTYCIWIMLVCQISGSVWEAIKTTWLDLKTTWLENGVNLDFQVKFDLERPGRSVHKTIGTLTKVFCIFGLSCGQASDRQTQTDRHRQTHTHTHRGNDNRPKLVSAKNEIHDKLAASLIEDWTNCNHFTGKFSGFISSVKFLSSCSFKFQSDLFPRFSIQFMAWCYWLTLVAKCINIINRQGC